MKTIYILIGPKGSGKTYIGELIEKTLGIRFLPIEPIFISLKGSRDILDEDFLREGYEAVAIELGRLLKKSEKIIIESTGVFPGFPEFFRRLQAKYAIRLINIQAPLAECERRIKMKDPAKHLTMSSDVVRSVNEKSTSLPYHYDGTIDNFGQSDSEIIQSFSKIM